MKHFKLLRIVMTLCSAVLRLNAQTNDWQPLQRIAPGSSISIIALNHHGTRECEIAAVTDSGLTCDLQRGRSHKRLSFLRGDIRQVRLEFPGRHHMLRGAILAGLAGAAMGGLLGGQSSDPETRRAAPAFGALLGTSLGAGVGRAIHQHGPLLYQRK